MSADWNARGRQPAITRVGLLYQTKNPGPAALAADISRYLADRRVAAFCAPLGREAELFAHQPELLITFGGDGSILRAARHAAGKPVALLGINYGRLGFLTECQPGEWRPALERVLAGEFRRERRALLSVRLDDEGVRGPEYLAVNDVALTRGDQPRAIRAQLRVDGRDLGEVVADGLVCSTATGSTGYNLSTGGPILPPEFRGFAVTAVAAHLSLFRPMVLLDEQELQLKASGTGGVILTLDGQVDVPMRPDQHVHVCVARAEVVFARTHPPAEFYATLGARLQAHL
jgi:NAD+ kinase